MWTNRRQTYTLRESYIINSQLWYYGNIVIHNWTNPLVLLVYCKSKFGTCIKLAIHLNCRNYEYWLPHLWSLIAIFINLDCHTYESWFHHLWILNTRISIFQSISIWWFVRSNFDKEPSSEVDAKNSIINTNEPSCIIGLPHPWHWINNRNNDHWISVVKLIILVCGLMNTIQVKLLYVAQHRNVPRKG